MRLIARAAAVVLLAVASAACSDDGGGASASSSTDTSSTSDSTTAAPLRILVTNDDGVGAAGIDALVAALAELPGIEFDVVAPAENQSGTGSQTTPGAVGFADAETASGYEAVAVDGFPADTVAVALDELGIEPDLVISGVNQGQNLGPAVDLSGTVGAAKAAAARGLPALAVSAGLAEEIDYADAVLEAVEWIDENGEDLVPLAGVVTNLNVPTCATGEPRDEVEIDVATDLGGRDLLGPSDCTSTATGYADDIDAFTIGFVTLSTFEP